MPAPLPASLQNRFQQSTEEGLSTQSAAGRLRISTVTGVRWVQRIRPKGEAYMTVMGQPVGYRNPTLDADFIQN